MIRAAEALDRLMAGNERFSSGHRDESIEWTPERRRQLAIGQTPHTIVLACSDSRTTPSMVFDQGLGDLFVVRVAGNVVGPDQIGSIEFAAHQLGTRLIVVLGHSNCGAISATLDDVQVPNPGLTPAIRSIATKIRPAVLDALEETPVSASDPEGRLEVLANAGRLNVVNSIASLTDQSELLADMTNGAGLVIVGARHILDTGIVEFFHGLEKIERA